MANPSIDASLIEHLSRNTVALILAGGRGSRLHGLTDHRAKPALYFGGRFRIIDFALSNCINSGINRIGVITQYKAHSLIKHIQHGWSFLNPARNQFIDILPARQQLDNGSWYRGTADAVYQNIGLVRHSYRPKYVVILAGDHIYKINYINMLLDHIRFGGECTVGCIEVPRSEAHAFGIMSVDTQYKITQFVEKPKDPPAHPGDPKTCLASMGIYIFNADYLYHMLDHESQDPDTSYDFGNDLIPHAVAQGKAYAHPFSHSCTGKTKDASSYWRDVGTIDSYWEANMDLISANPQLDMSDDSWPIYSCLDQNNPTRFIQRDGEHESQVRNSLVPGGCTIEDARIINSVLFHKVKVNSGSTVDASIILPDVTIGQDCRLHRCVIDRNCIIPDGTVIGEDAELDASRFHRSSGGIVLVTPIMLERLAVKPPEVVEMKLLSMTAAIA